MPVLSTSKHKPVIRQARLVLDAKSQLGEGCFWHSSRQELCWVDIEGRQLHFFDPVSGRDEAVDLPARIGTAAPVKGGGMLLALQNGIHFLDNNGKFHLLTNPLENLPGLRFNDGKADPFGRFWVGSMHLEIIPGAASLYRMDQDGSIHQQLDGLTISNGMAWSEDRKTFYFIDTPRRMVEAFDFDAASGTINNRREIVQFPEDMGQPDGMTIDRLGRLWVAMWGGGRVIALDPATGECMEQIMVTAPQVTSCCFGGPELRTLYITTASVELDEAQRSAYRLSGGVFAVDTEVAGWPVDEAELIL